MQKSKDLSSDGYKYTTNFVKVAGLLYPSTFSAVIRLKLGTKNRLICRY